MQKKSGFKKAYLIMSAVLLAAIIVGLIFVWKACVNYQQNSSSTILNQVKTELERKLGYELDLNKIPITNENGEYEYHLKYNKKSIAKVTLEQTGSGIMNLALFKLKDVSPEGSFSIIITNGDSLLVDGRSLDYSSAEDYKFTGTETLYDRGFDLPALKKVKVENVFDLSQISVKRGDDELSFVKITDNTYFATRKINDSTIEAIRERVNEFSDLYSHYISGDTSYYEFSGCFAYGSPLVERFITLDVQWYTYHTYAENINMKISEPVYLSDRYALVCADFDFYVEYSDTSSTVNTKLTYILHLGDNGYWYMSELATGKIEGLEYSAQGD